MENNFQVIKACGNIRTYIVLENDYEFKLNNGLKLRLLINKKHAEKIDFELSGNILSHFLKKEEIVSLIKKITSYISFHYNAPCSEPNISEITIHGGGEVNIAVSERNCEVTGIIVSTEKDTSDLQKLLLHNKLSLLDEEKILVFDLFRKCITTEDLYSRFWYIYTIFSILIGEREDIDTYIQSNFNQITKGQCGHVM